jgi:hypothetical protein
MTDDPDYPGSDSDSIAPSEVAPPDAQPVGRSETDPALAVRPGPKVWIASGLGAVALTAASILGIRAASGTSGAQTATTPAGASAPGSTGGATQGGPPGNAAPGGAMPGALPGGGAVGTITSIDGSTLTVQDRSGATTKIATTADTVITASHEATADDLAVGDHVSVDGSGSSTAITAERVTDSGDVAAADGFGGGPGGVAPSGPPPSGAMPGGPSSSETDGSASAPTPPADAGDHVRTSGVIASIDGDTMVVTTTDGDTVTVTLSDSTSITTSSVASVDDLAEGDTVLARGQSADGTLTATVIIEGDLPMGRGAGQGPPRS